MKIKNLITATVIMAMVLCGSVAFAVSAEKNIKAKFSDIKVHLNGYQVNLTDANGNDVEPFIVDGTVYMPVRSLADLIGYNVKWNSKTNTIYLDSYPYFMYEDELPPESFLRIFIMAGAYEMVSFTRVGMTEDNYAEIIFDLVTDYRMRINANAVSLRNVENKSYNLGVIESGYADVMGDQAVYYYYADDDAREPEGYIIFILQANGNIRVEQHGNVGLGLGVSLNGEYEFSGLG